MHRAPFNKLRTINNLSAYKYNIDYLPTAMDESLTLLQKVNMLIYNVNQTNAITNDLAERWNEIIEWLNSEALGKEVEKILEKWLSDGTLADIITDAVLGDIEKIKLALAEFEQLKKDFDKLRYDVDSITQTSGNAIYQKLIMRPFFGTETEQIFSGAENAPQGLAYVEFKGKKYVFILSRVEGTTWTKAERHRITQFELTEDGSLTQPLTFTKPLELGHQGLSAMVDNDKIWLFAGYGYGDLDNNGKGYTKIEWKGSNTDECDIYRYRLLGAHGSNERYNEYNHATPTISTDGRFIVLAVATTFDANTRYMLIFDRKQVERAENPMSVPALNIFQIYAAPYKGSHIVQDVACDGNYVYIYTSDVAPLGVKVVTIMSMQGFVVGYYKVDGGLALYKSLTGDPRYGNATQMEAEGITIMGSDLLLLSTDVWQKDGQYTKRDKLIYKIYRGCATCEGEPINQGIQPLTSPASVHIRGTAHDVSFPYGDGFTVSQWDEENNKIYPSISYNGQYIFRIYDTRPDSNNDLPMTFRNNKAPANQGGGFTEIRSGSTVVDGSAINLYNTNNTTAGGSMRLYVTDPATLETVYFQIYHNGSMVPSTDNIQNLGSSARRMRNIYAGTANINTSDERHKTDIKPIPDNVLDAWEKVNFYQYKFKDAVEEKGDEARYHFGVIAQEIVKVFEEEGLNAFDYGLIGYDEWDATEDEYDEEGNLIDKGREAGNIYSIRPTECQWLEMACMRRKLERMG